MTVNSRKRNTVKQRDVEIIRIKVLPLRPVAYSRLQAYTMPWRRAELTPDVEEFLQHEHRAACQMLGYLAPTDHNTLAVPRGPYVPAEERKRQLAVASDKRRQELKAKWGLDQGKNNDDKKKLKADLRAGTVAYPCMKTVRQDNPRSLELALQASVSIKGEEEENEANKDQEHKVKNKHTLRKELRKRDNLKKLKDAARKVQKRKNVLQQISDMKRERRAAIIAAVVPELINQESVHDGEDKKEAAAAAVSSIKQSAMVQSITGDASDTTPSTQFVFNLEDVHNKPDTKKKKKATTAELKQQLADELQKRKMLIALKESGDDSSAKDVISSHNWAQAEKKLKGEKVYQINNLTRDIKRAEIKEQNKGKKVKEVLQRQKNEKHKKTTKRLQNLREQRVGRLAKKMKRFSKKGHIVPGFM